MNKINTYETAKVFEVGRINWWSFFPWNQRWELEPISDSPLKPPVVKRIRAIQNVGIKIKRVYVAHEPRPAWLPEPRKVDLPEIYLPEINLPWKEIGRVILTISKVLAVSAGVLALASSIMPVLVVMVALALLDPVYVIELESGDLIEIYSER